MSHTIILSDVHLCEAYPEGGEWMAHRQARSFPDVELAELFDGLCQQMENDRLEVVFNGDLFDFDAPEVVAGSLRFNAESHTPAGAARRLVRILEDHPTFTAALGRVLAHGHGLVFIAGNHDASLIFSDAREILAAQLLKAAGCVANETAQPVPSAACRERIRFYEWFYVTAGGVHIEHGHQYDPFCAYSDPTRPFLPDGTHVRPTMGSLLCRHLVGRLGFFNPFVDDNKLRSSLQYVIYGIRCGFLSKHAMISGCFMGALKTTVAVWRARQSTLGAGLVVRLAAVTGMSSARLIQHVALFSAPLDATMRKVFRALWLDRALFVLLMVALPIPAWMMWGAFVAIIVASCIILVMTAYEIVVPKVAFQDAYSAAWERAKAVAEIYGARAVVFGHTHVAGERWQKGIFFGNSGSWSGKDKTVIWLRHAGSSLVGGLHKWCNGRLVPVEESG